MGGDGKNNARDANEAGALTGFRLQGSVSVCVSAVAKNGRAAWATVAKAAVLQKRREKRLSMTDWRRGRLGRDRRGRGWALGWGKLSDGQDRLRLDGVAVLEKVRASPETEEHGPRDESRRYLRLGDRGTRGRVLC